MSPSAGYNRLKSTPNLDITPRTFIFGGKAAPSYGMAKLIINLINAVANAVNRDPQVRQTLKVVFVPDFNVQNAQIIYPAADLSEQISTAGKEASGHDPFLSAPITAPTWSARTASAPTAPLANMPKISGGYIQFRSLDEAHGWV